MIYTNLTRKAMQLAYKAHDGQFDKSGVPYIFHPLHVAEQMTDEASVCVALLHDVVEDTDLTIDTLRKEGFSENILEAISLLTHDKTIPYMDYIKAIKTNPLATKVKLVDLEHNSDLSRVKCVDEKARNRIEKYKKAKKLLTETSTPNRNITKMVETTVDIKYARIALEIAGYDSRNMTEDEVFKQAVKTNEDYAVTSKIYDNIKVVQAPTTPQKGDSTGFFDEYGNEIFVGDIVKEACNGLEAEVIWDYKRGSFWMKNLGEGYDIEDSHIEWEIIAPYDKNRTLSKEPLSTTETLNNRR